MPRPRLALDQAAVGFSDGVSLFPTIRCCTNQDDQIRAPCRVSRHAADLSGVQYVAVVEDQLFGSSGVEEACACAEENYMTHDEKGYDCRQGFGHTALSPSRCGDALPRQVKEGSGGGGHDTFRCGFSRR